MLVSLSAIIFFKFNLEHIILLCVVTNICFLLEFIISFNIFFMLISLKWFSGSSIKIKSIFSACFSIELFIFNIHCVPEPLFHMLTPCSYIVRLFSNEYLLFVDNPKSTLGTLSFKLDKLLVSKSFFNFLNSLLYKFFNELSV